ncbi:MAG: hypothetical protein AAF755_10235 [Pseudomonadota bacterium]
MSFVKHEPRNADEKRMWAYMTSVQQFTHKMVSQATGVSVNKRQNYIAHLKEHGYVRRLGRKANQLFFTAHADLDIPEFNGKRRTTIEGKYWSAMRSLGTFSAQDIAAIFVSDVDDITMESIENYIEILLKGDFLRRVGHRQNGSPASRYRLVNNTGPLPPLQRRAEVIIDQNKEQVVYVNGVAL